MTDEQNRHLILADGVLVKEVSIKEIRPCIVAEGMVRVLMQLDNSLDTVIPSLMTIYPPGKVNYIKNKNILTLSLHNRLITIYPSGKVSMNKTLDEEDALEAITKIMVDINQAHLQESTTGTSDLQDAQERLSNLGPLDLYHCLPQTGCGECGEATCTAFAMKLLSGDTTLDCCTPLKESEHKEKLRCLENLLGEPLMAALGWKTQ
ncbi:MAG: (Fe-S)-binding protein [Euryarchaeota archaeon]|jgi:ArsR family metal-binding transcriptional regulator|nr:(Fe-S)-binding protein [Euryarchaeota archaeon]